MSAGNHSVGHPVDVASGTVYSTHRDYTIPGRVELIWERHYSTALLDSPAGPLGPGWTTRYFATLTRLPGEYQFVTPNGDLETFSDPGGEVERGGTIRNLGTFQELMKSNGRYVVVRWDVESGNVERYFFREGKPGEVWPLDSIEDVTGQGLDMIRDKAGRLSGVRQLLEQRSMSIEYSSSGRIQQIMFVPAGGDAVVLARYEYDGNGRLAAAFDAQAFADRYEYDAAGRIVRELVKDGGVFSFRYDDRGRCVKTWGVDRYDEKTLRYRDAIGWTEVTDSLGNTTRYRWLATGQVVEVIDPLGASTQTEYDEHGRIVATTNPNGAVTRYAFDNEGNQCTIANPLGESYQVEFNGQHLAIKFTDPAGNVAKREYDGHNRLVATEDALGARWTIAYDSAGNPVTVTSPSGARKRQTFSNAGQRVEATDWVGNVTRYACDGFGRVTRRTGPDGDTSSIRYDVLGQPVEVRASDGSTIRGTYDKGGNLVSVTNANGYTTKLRYGACKRLLEKTDRLGGVARYYWGSEPKQLTKIVNERGESYEFVHDRVGRVVSEKAFDGTEYRLEYDAAGQVIARTNGLGQTILLKRDLAGRITEEVAADGTGAEYRYDAIGNLIATVNADCSVVFERDALGRVIKELQGETVVETQYDRDGNAAGAHTSFGHHAEYVYDGNGLLSRLEVAKQPFLEMARNGRGQETSRLLPGDVRLHHDYDLGGRIREQVVTRGSATQARIATTADGAIVRRIYAYDKSGALTSLVDKQWGQVTYDYDPAEQLLRVLGDVRHGEGFAYDSAGNVTSIQNHEVNETVGYGPGNRLLQKGTTQYYHDANGRLIRKVEKADTSAPREWKYAWDALDQLRSVQRPDGEVWKYGYDGLGRRVFKQGPDTRIDYVWNQEAIVHEIENSELKSTWLYDQLTLTPLGTIQNGQAYAVVTDHLGTPRELIGKDGSVAWSADSRAWGATKQLGTAGVNCDIRFRGQWSDSESGLHYNRFRYYDPEAARFVSSDPIRVLGGLNTYAYTRNPINWLDPTGLSSPPPGDWENPHPSDYRAPDRIPPGTPRVAAFKISENTGQMYLHVTHYDEQGRMVGQTHYTNHGRGDHTDPHHHRYDPNTGEKLRVEHRKKGSPKNFPGVHPDEENPPKGCSGGGG